MDFAASDSGISDFRLLEPINQTSWKHDSSVPMIIVLCYSNVVNYFMIWIMMVYAIVYDMICLFRSIYDIICLMI